MPRSVLFFLFGLSLAANAGLVYSLRRTAPATPVPATAPTAPAVHPSTSRATTLSASGAISPETPRTAADFRGIAAELRAAGLSEAMVQRVILLMVSEEFTRRRRAVFDSFAAPYWKIAMPTADQSKAMRELDRERREMLESLGVARTPEELLIRRRQFGNLSEAKIAALDKVQQDYSELRREIFEQQRTGGDARGQNLSAQIKLLDEEQRRDIDALLTPEEKLEYELRSSETASRLRGQLRSLDLTEQEYRALFVAQKAYDDARIGSGPRNAEEAEREVAHWEQLQSDARRTLGDDRYKQYLITSQLAGRGAEQFFAERPAITVDQIQAIVRMNASLPAEMVRETSAPGLSAEERRARATAIAQRYQATLTQLVGADTAKEIQARNIVSLPRGISGGAIGLPAVRLPGGN